MEPTEETAVPVTSDSFFEAMESVAPKDKAVAEKTEISEESGLVSEDEKLLSLSKHPGWEIIARRMKSDIEAIASASEVRQGESMDVYGARRAAGDSVIKYVKGYLNTVDSIVNYANEEQKRREQANQ